MEYKHNAFISYSHADKEFAFKLKEKLHSYMISMYSNINADYTKANIFIDDEYLEFGELNTNLENNLKASEYLIIICSENSAKSEWVNKEVELFNSLENRTMKIIPVLYSPEEINFDALLPDELFSYFTPALQEIETANEHLRMHGKEVVENPKSTDFLRIEAALHHCEYNDLLNWELRKGTKKYYSDYVTKFEVPIGINELSEEIKKHRNTYYIFEYDEKGLVRRVIYNNFANKTEEHESEFSVFKNRPPIMEITYDSEDLVLSVNYKNKNNNIVLVKNYRKNLSCVYFETQNGCSTDIQEINGIRNSYPENVHSLLLERDIAGFVTKEKFYADERNEYPVSTDNGLAGYAYEYDNLGRIIFRWKIDKNDEIIEIADIAGEKITYDDKGNVSSVEYLAKESSYTKEVIYQHSFTHLVLNTYEYDQYGNIIRVTFKNENRKLQNIAGIAVKEKIYTVDGALESEIFFDERHQPSNYYEGYSLTNYEYNDNLDLVCKTFFNNENQPVKGTSGYHKELSFYDERRRLIKCLFLDEDNEPVIIDDGFAEINFCYDENNSVTKIIYKGLEDEILESSAEFFYSQTGNLIEKKYIKVPSDGKTISRITYEYTPNEKLRTKIEYAGFLMMGLKYYEQPIRTYKFKYDEIGQQIEEIMTEHLTSGDQTLRIENRFNDECKISRKTYFDNSTELQHEEYFYLNGIKRQMKKYTPSSKINGTIIEVTNYNEKGGISARCYFTENEKPLVNERNVFKTEYEEKFVTKENEYGSFNITKIIKIIKMYGNNIDNRENISRVEESINTLTNEIIYRKYYK